MHSPWPGVDESEETLQKICSQCIEYLSESGGALNKTSFLAGCRKLCEVQAKPKELKRKENTSLNHLKKTLT